jgi:hypothetical protein
MGTQTEDRCMNEGMGGEGKRSREIKMSLGQSTDGPMQTTANIVDVLKYGFLPNVPK